MLRNYFHEQNQTSSCTYLAFKLQLSNQNFELFLQWKYRGNRMSRGETVIVEKETTIHIFSYCRNLARGKSLNAVYVQLWSRKKKDKKCASIQRYENHPVVRSPQWRLF